jgi:hypothetical protein
VSEGVAGRGGGHEDRGSCSCWWGHECRCHLRLQGAVNSNAPACVHGNCVCCIVQHVACSSPYCTVSLDCHVCACVVPDNVHPVHSLIVLQC